MWRFYKVHLKEQKEHSAFPAAGCSQDNILCQSARCSHIVQYCTRHLSLQLYVCVCVCLCLSVIVNNGHSIEFFVFLYKNRVVRYVYEVSKSRRLSKLHDFKVFCPWLIRAFLDLQPVYHGKCGSQQHIHPHNQIRLVEQYTLWPLAQKSLMGQRLIICSNTKSRAGSCSVIRGLSDTFQIWASGMLPLTLRHISGSLAFSEFFLT